MAGLAMIIRGVVSTQKSSFAILYSNDLLFLLQKQNQLCWNSFLSGCLRNGGTDPSDLSIGSKLLNVPKVHKDGIEFNRTKMILNKENLILFQILLQR